MRSVLRAIAAVATLVLVFAITSCGSSEANGTVVRVGPQQAVSLIKSGRDVVVDLRSPRDFAAGHVAGAINIDADAPDFEQRVKALDDSSTYLVYASNKARSAPAADEIANLGIDRVVDAGGFGLLALSGADLE